MARKEVFEDGSNMALEGETLCLRGLRSPQRSVRGAKPNPFLWALVSTLARAELGQEGSTNDPQPHV